ncbi:hypothetical protein HK098_002213 [Nowakowskiella sp. JEL0407]|nr:hypothetical protein HK098_002213 [Nowakowskiella sp. JEL0407]
MSLQPVDEDDYLHAQPFQQPSYYQSPQMAARNQSQSHRYIPPRTSSNSTTPEPPVWSTQTQMLSSNLTQFQQSPYNDQLSVRSLTRKFEDGSNNNQQQPLYAPNPRTLTGTRGPTTVRQDYGFNVPSSPPNQPQNLTNYKPSQPPYSSNFSQQQYGYEAAAIPNFPDANLSMNRGSSVSSSTLNGNSQTPSYDDGNYKSPTLTGYTAYSGYQQNGSPQMFQGEMQSASAIAPVDPEISALKEEQAKLKFRHQKIKEILLTFRNYNNKLIEEKDTLADTWRDIEGMRNHRVQAARPALENAMRHKEHFARLIIDRTNVTAALRPLIGIQEQVEVVFLEGVEAEKKSKEEFELLSTQLKEHLEHQDMDETLWLQESLEKAPDIRKWQDERDRIQRELNEQYLARLNQSHMEMQQIFNNISRLDAKLKALMQGMAQMQPTMFAILGLIIGKIGAIQKEFKDIKHRLDWEEQIQLQQEIADNIEIDRIRPWSSSTPVPWGLQIEMKIRKYIPSPNVSYQLGYLTLPFDGLNWKEDIRTMQFKFMSSTLPTGENIVGKSFSKGTYRAARFSEGSDGKIYVVKTFHLRRGISTTAQGPGELKNDRDSAEKVSKGNALVTYCAKLFTMELARRGFSQFEVEYVDVYVGECVFFTHESLKFKQPPGTCLMIEPLLPGQFKKWVNNNMAVINPDPDDLDSQICSTFAHWSYEWSGRSMIISDLQGSRIDEQRYVQVHPSQPPMIRNHCKWQLNDPAVHFVSKDPQAVQLKNRLKHDMDGDLGLQALQGFHQGTHRCNQYCAALGLAPLAPAPM